MGFPSRREAMRAPNVDNDRAETQRFGRYTEKGSWALPPATQNSSRPNATSTTVRAHTDQGSQAAARVLIPPASRFRSLPVSDTTPLYRMVIFWALRHALRSKNLWRTSENSLGAKSAGHRTEPFRGLPNMALCWLPVTGRPGNGSATRVGYPHLRDGGALPGARLLPEARDAEDPARGTWQGARRHAAPEEGSRLAPGPGHTSLPDRPETERREG